MKLQFLSWFGGKHANKKQNTYPTTCQRKQEPREEFSDWPHSLLAIGTFGNSSNNVIIKENPSSDKNNNVEDPSSSSSITDQEIAVDFSPEEIGKLQKELTKLLRRKPTNVEKEIAAELPLDRFLNCPSSLEVDRRISNAATICSDNNNIININNINSAEEDNNNNKEENIDKTLSVILGKCKEISADKKNMKAVVGKKSIAFLLKKMFVCTSGFAPTAPTLRDTLQESRMDKLLRSILHKKIYSQQQNCPRPTSMKKCLEDRKMPKKRNGDEAQDTAEIDGSKWVKTDSEYIVLEI